jgi:recombinational DNA repair ATPase RecF
MSTTSTTTHEVPILLLEDILLCLDAAADAV